jgi:hypothetical protein
MNFRMDQHTILDVGLNLGLNKAAPKAQVYSGISLRFLAPAFGYCTRTNFRPSIMLKLGPAVSAICCSTSVREIWAASGKYSADYGPTTPSPTRATTPSRDGLGIDRSRVPRSTPRRPRTGSSTSGGISPALSDVHSRLSTGVVSHNRDGPVRRGMRLGRRQVVDADLRIYVREVRAVHKAASDGGMRAAVRLLSLQSAASRT